MVGSSSHGSRLKMSLIISSVSEVMAGVQTINNIFADLGSNTLRSTPDGDR